MLAEEALSKERNHPSATPPCGRHGHSKAMPDVPIGFVLCTQDRFFPPDFMRRQVVERLGITPDEIAAGHRVALSRPKELADILRQHARG